MQESCSLVPWACQIIMFILVMVKCFVKRFDISEVHLKVTIMLEQVRNILDIFYLTSEVCILVSEWDIFMKSSVSVNNVILQISVSVYS